MSKLQVTKKDLLETIDAISSFLPGKLEVIDELNKVLVKNGRPAELCRLVITMDIKCKDDVEYFTNIKKAIKQYLALLPDIRSKVENFPESFEVDEDDLNTTSLLFLIDTGIFLNNDLADIISYVIDVVYSKKRKGTDLMEEYSMLYKDIAMKIRELNNIVNFILRGNPEEIIEKIGNFPVEKQGFFSKIKAFLGKFLRKEVGITNNVNVGFLSDKIKIVTDSDNLPTTNFVGNPIYHFRKFLVDLELKKLESLKDRKRLLELKLAELKQQQAGKPNDPKLQKQIEYYEKKLEQVEHKIDVIVNG